MKIALLITATTLGATAPGADPKYLDCISLIEANLEIGRIAAQQWTAEGGGNRAQHCLAVADLAAGFPKLAALRLEEIAKRLGADDPLIRARLLSQAATAWLEAAMPEQADATINQAMQLAPSAGELHLVAARVYHAQKRWLAVIKAVSAAEDDDIASAAGYVARARAQLSLGNNEAAANDVVRTLNLDPLSVDALVLRGELRQAGVVIEVHYGSDR